MSQITRFILLFVIITYQTDVLSANFEHFKLKGSLKEINKEISDQLNSQVKSRFGIKSLNSNKLIDQDPTIDDKVSPLLEELTAALSGSYQNIGMDQTRRLMDNYDLGGGVLNFSGFTWYKPMLNYQVTANREVAPHWNSDRWIVHDSFTIYIEAATLLSNLQEKNLIEIDNSTIGAFAGVTFKRTYHYYHFSKDYMDGISADFSKLLLTFLKFNNKGVLELADYEAMKKTDTFSFNAGGVITAPVGSGASMQAGVLVNTAYKSEVLVQNVGPEDKSRPDEILRIEIDREYNKSASAHLSLQYDFFNLLKISLLSYDLEYEYAEANKTFLTFYESDKKDITEPGRHRTEFHNFLKGKDEVLSWRKSITQMEKRLKENFSSKFGFLLFGTMKKRATEQHRIIKDGIEKIFFKNYSESVEYIQSLLSRFYQAVVQKIFDFEMTVTNKAEIKKKFVIEYEQMKDLGPASVDTEEKFSIKLKQYFHVAKTHKWYHRSFYKSAIKYTKRITNLSGELIRKVSNKELRGPLTINSTIEVNKVGLYYFNQLPEKNIIDATLSVCRVKDRDKETFHSEKHRKKLFKQRLKGSQYCAKKMLKRYFKYIGKYINYEVIDLTLFKKFMGYYFSKAKGLSEIKAVFGNGNVFVHGDFRAQTKSKRNFQTYFKAGQFRGLGVIDEFKRGNLITPVNTKKND
jgi:hypothetical protein